MENDKQKKDLSMKPEMLSACIDHTLLKPDATAAQIIQLCREAIEYQFFSVCVNPVHVRLSKEQLRGTPVKVCCVVGFPLGAGLTQIKALETGRAIEDGADEIDMVIHIGALKDGDVETVETDIRSVVAAAAGRPVKVIIETGLLDRDQKIMACRIAQKAGARFVKTSTGFAGSGATAEDVALMKKTVENALGVKASGGIKTLEEALEMIAAGADRIGASAGVAIMKAIRST